MQTHKNTALRATSTVPAKTKTASPKAAPKFGAPVKKDPVFDLDGKKWMVCIITVSSLDDNWSLGRTSKWQ